MTTFSDRLALIITADTRGAVQGLEKVGSTAEKELTKAEKKLDVIGGKMTRWGIGAVASGVVVGAGLLKAATAYDEANQAAVKLDNTLRNQPALAGANRKALLDLAQSIQHTTAADGDEVVAMMAKLGQYKVTEEQLRTLTPLVVDYARKNGKDLVTAAGDVGKALNGQSRALKQAGVDINQALYATDRYTATMNGLRTAVGGFATEEGKTFSGQLQRLGNDLRDLEEGVGKGVADALSGMIGNVDKLTASIGSGSEETQAAIGKWATYGAGLLVTAGATSTILGQGVKLGRQMREQKDSVLEFAKNLRTLDGAARGVQFAGITAGVALLTYELVQADRKAREFVEGLKIKGGDDPIAQIKEIQDGIASLKDEASQGVQLGGPDSWIGIYTSNKAKEANHNIRGAKAELESLTGTIKAQAEAAIQNGDLTNESIKQYQWLIENTDLYNLSTKERTELEKAFAEAAKATTEALHKQRDAEAAQAKGTLIDERFAMANAEKNLADAVDAQARAEEDRADRVRQAERDIESSKRDLADAHQAVADAVNSEAEAYRQAQDAQTSAANQAESADIANIRAQDRLAEAQAAYNDALAGGDQQKIHDAELDLRDAKLQAKEASERLVRAQQDLNDVRGKSLDQMPQVKEWQQRVTDAKDAERDATQRLKDAEKARKDAAEDGAKSVVDANGRVAESLRKLQEEYLKLIAAAIIYNEKATAATGMPAGRYGNTGPTGTGYVPNYTPNVPTGGRAATGAKGGDTYITVTVDGETQTTKSAIHQGIKKASKQAAISYYRRAA